MRSALFSLAHCLALSAMFGCAGSSTEPPSMDLPPGHSDAPLGASAAPAASAAATTPVASAASAAASGDAASFHDTLAGLAPGASQDELEKRFGKPKSTSPLQEEQATGEFVSLWRWADGLSAMMTATSAKGKLEARLLVVEVPSKLSTSRGIGVGSTRKEVEAAYAQEIDKQVSTDAMVVVGEMLGGLRLHFDKQQRVRSLALGSDGE